MKMIYQYRVLSDEVEDFALDIEAPYDMKLSDFNDYLMQQLDYDPSMLCSIFCSDSQWEKLQEYTSFDMGISDGDFEFALSDESDAPQSMSNVTLDDVTPEKFDRLVFVFDPISERQLYIELLQPLKVEDGVVYPRVIAKNGTPPPQITDFEL